MRLWSLHPAYLDRQGLIALWREGLLAQKVLAGKTRGYKHHPQLIRFRESRDPLGAISVYLRIVAEEAAVRGYSFDGTKLLKPKARPKPIPVSRGQLKYETEHLFRKLEQRDPARLQALAKKKILRPHPSFRAVAGGIHDWEKI